MLCILDHLFNILMRFSCRKTHFMIINSYFMISEEKKDYSKCFMCIFRNVEINIKTTQRKETLGNANSHGKGKYR